MNPFIGTLLGNIIISVTILILLFLLKKFQKKLYSYIDLIKALTVGVLLGIIFLGFFPKITEVGKLTGEKFGIFLLIGVFIFYILEILLHWHHCNDTEHSHTEEHKNGILMFAGTMLHNAFHGVVLFSAFSVDTSFGWATVIAIALHSIPQNIVNSVMNHTQSKYAYIGAFGGILGAIFTLPFAHFLIENKYIILSIISGGLLYTALTDIFPSVKNHQKMKYKIIHLIAILIGIALFVGFEQSTHSIGKSSAPMPKKSVIIWGSIHCPHCIAAMPVFEEKIYNPYHERINITINALSGEKFAVNIPQNTDSEKFPDFQKITGKECKYIPTFVVLDEKKQVLLSSCGGEKDIDDILDILQ